MRPNSFQMVVCVLPAGLLLLAIVMTAAVQGAASPEGSSPGVPEGDGNVRPSFDALVTQIKTGDKQQRIDAAQQLGETNRPAAVPVLKEAFDQAPKHHGIIGVEPGLADACIRSLGRLGIPEARLVLRDIAEEYAYRGVTFDHAGKKRYDGQTLNFVGVALRVLGDQGDKETQGFVLKMAKDERVPADERLVIWRWCYEAAMKIEMQLANASTPVAKGAYIARLLSGDDGTKLGGQPASELKVVEPVRKAAASLLLQNGPEALQEAERLLLKEGVNDVNRSLLQQVRRKLENQQKAAEVK